MWAISLLWLMILLLFLLKEAIIEFIFGILAKINAISIMKNSNLNEKSGSLWFSLLYIKNEWNNLLSKKQRNNTKQSQRIL